MSQYRARVVLGPTYHICDYRSRSFDLFDLVIYVIVHLHVHLNILSSLEFFHLSSKIGSNTVVLPYT